MRIVYISELFPPRIVGGAEIFAAALASAMAMTGMDVTVITLGDSRQRTSADRYVDGVKIIQAYPWNIYYPYDGTKRSLPVRLAFHAWESVNLSAYRQTVTLLKSLEPDLVHTHNLGGFGELAWLAAARLGIPIIHTAHDYHLLCPRRTLLRSHYTLCQAPRLACRIWRWWHLQTSRWPTVFVSPSRFLLELHIRAGLQTKRSLVIPNGIPSLNERRSSRRERRGAAKTFLFLGRLSPEKGVRVLLEAFKQAAETAERSIHSVPRLVVAGKGPLAGLVTRYASNSEVIRYVGFVSGSEKAPLLRYTDVVLIPSLWYENQPVAALEAWSLGIPVIASKIGALGELIAQTEGGMLVPPGDADALARAILRLATDEETYMRYREKALAAAQKYTLKECIATYEELYRETLRYQPARSS